MQAERYVILSVNRAEVLRLVVAGLPADAIAEELGISRKRVYDHLKELRNAGFLPK
jgi:DNA-binding CsgD family transcriptional regulator